MQKESTVELPWCVLLANGNELTQALRLTRTSQCNLMMFALQIGFFALIAVEVILGRGLLETVGLRVGNGLPFEL